MRTRQPEGVGVVKHRLPAVADALQDEADFGAYHFFGLTPSGISGGSSIRSRESDCSTKGRRRALRESRRQDQQAKEKLPESGRIHGLYLLSHSEFSLRGGLDPLLGRTEFLNKSGDGKGLPIARARMYEGRLSGEVTKVDGC